MANTKVRIYPAFIKDGENPEYTIGIKAKSLTEAHDTGLVYCQTRGLYLVSVGMPKQ